MAAINEIESKSCLKFTKKTEKSRNWIRFVDRGA